MLGLPRSNAVEETDQRAGVFEEVLLQRRSEQAGPEPPEAPRELGLVERVDASGYVPHPRLGPDPVGHFFVERGLTLGVRFHLRIVEQVGIQFSILVFEVWVEHLRVL